MASTDVVPSMGRLNGSALLREDISRLNDAYDADENTLDDLGRSRKLAMLKLLWAFYCIQNIDPKERNSFFRIAGYHGMPFRGAGWGNPSWWGGYCNHGNVLFPTWHRAYLVRLENALRAVSGYHDISLPYWNETSSQARNHGIPTIFLKKMVLIPYSMVEHTRNHGTLERFPSPADPTTGELYQIPNPLRSYKFQDGLWDNLNPIPDADYSRPKGYETTRYPFSGLSSSDDAGATIQHNKLVGMLDTDELLQQNVINWLDHNFQTSDGTNMHPNTYCKYKRCLTAPNYTVFSNTTSATQYNEDVYYNTPGNDVSPQTVPSEQPRLPIVSLESPHNDIHLAIGGFDIPGLGNVDSIIGANGDMGENDTAAFDPIFYFHHCFIDKVFWDWQRIWNSCTELTIEAGYPGTNSIDSQGPTPGVPGNTWLTMESPLAPFTIDDEENGNALTSNDVVHIARQLGYKYYPDDDIINSGGEFDGSDGGSDCCYESSTGDGRPTSVPVVRVSGVNRAALSGSFALVVRAEVNGEDTVVGTESVLSRWKVSGCANCQQHLGVKAFVPLVGVRPEALSTVRVGLHARGKRMDDINNDHSIGGGWQVGNMDGTQLRIRSGYAVGSGVAVGNMDGTQVPFRTGHAVARA